MSVVKVHLIPLAPKHIRNVFKPKIVRFRSLPHRRDQPFTPNGMESLIVLPDFADFDLFGCKRLILFSQRFSLTHQEEPPSGNADR
jgi:hypothetical protein